MKEIAIKAPTNLLEHEILDCSNLDIVSINLDHLSSFSNEPMVLTGGGGNVEAIAKYYALITC